MESPLLLQHQACHQVFLMVREFFRIIITFRVDTPTLGGTTPNNDVA